MIWIWSDLDMLVRLCHGSHRRHGFFPMIFGW
uniref:Uncharacterized protein n=1 Tax=Anguilla anguilla TaxID=7936 RepID=A0A0E9PZL6_ANGAN